MAQQKVTAGREALGDFAPKFAELNDDVLFGEIWSREKLLSLRDRSLITVTALMSSGVLDSTCPFISKRPRKTASPGRKSPKSSPSSPFTAAGPRRGRHSGWQKRSGQRTEFIPTAEALAGNPAGALCTGIYFYFAASTRSAMQYMPGSRPMRNSAALIAPTAKISLDSAV